MPERVEIFTITCPANTAQANAIEQPLAMTPGEVETVEIVIPRGHVGITGLAIAYAHTIVIPNAGAAFIIGDSEKMVWPLANYGNTGAWSAFVYNGDNRAHLWQLRFHVWEIELSRPAPIQFPIPRADIYDAGDKAIARAIAAE